jgi:hypothetical protein
MKRRKFVVKAALNITYAMTVWDEDEEAALDSARAKIGKGNLKGALIRVIDDEISVEEAED